MLRWCSTRRAGAGWLGVSRAVSLSVLSISRVLPGVALALSVALLGGAGAAVAQADTVTQVPHESFAGLSCTNVAKQDCMAVADTPNSSSVRSQLVQISGGSAGTPVELPAGFGATNVACQSATSCVIVGVDNSAGAVVAITNGVVGSPQEVPAARVLVGVACSGGGSCVAVGTASDVPFASGPAAAVVPITNGVPGAMQTVAGVQELFAVACSGSTSCTAVGYGGFGSQCGPQSCTGSTLTGVVVSINDGTAGPAQPVSGTSSAPYLTGVACAPGSTSCVATDGRLVVPISNGAPGAAKLEADGLSGISCPTTGGCLAVGANQASSSSGVIVPIAIDGTPGAVRTEPGTSGLSRIDCADLTNCIAVGSADSTTGAIVRIGGTATSPSTAVSSALTVSGAASSIAAILHAGGYPATFTAPEAGSAQITWYDLPSGAHLARAKRPVLVARGSKRFTGAGQATLKIALTAQGRSLLKKAKRIKLTALGRFAPKSGKPTTTRKVITLKQH
jgi:hypothetical protein